jgi:hypothetical protein
MSQPVKRLFGSLTGHQCHDFRAKGGAMNYPRIIELNEAFITPFTSSDGLDITKLLKFATDFIVIDRLTRSGVPQRYNQNALK